MKKNINSIIISAKVLVILDKVKKLSLLLSDDCFSCHNNKPGKTVLIGADMDALPINDEADVEYKSKLPGKMHYLLLPHMDC